MASTFLRWLIPGAIVVIGGTAFALAQTDQAITSDLASRSGSALDTASFGWASVSIDGRDATVTGTATTPDMVEAAVQRVASVHGVRSVTSQISLAEMLTPYPFVASVKGGTIALSGAYPSESVHVALLEAARRATDRTTLHSGAPVGFEDAAKFGLAALSQLEEGEIQLTDLNLAVSGRAKSASAFDAIQTLPNSLPKGLRLASLKVSPPLASPYVWTATYDGNTLSITGNAPTADLAERLRAAAPANVPVSTTMGLASGEPAGFEANTLILLRSLLMLEQGEASISDGVISLAGAPASEALADAVRTTVIGLGGTVALEPPRVAEFELNVDKSPHGLLISGFVPDTETKARLAALPGADVSALALGRGAPDRLASGVDFGLSLLDHLAEGQFGLKGNRLSIGGRAATVSDFKAARDLVQQGAPQGFAVAAVTLHPPLADPFLWSVVKAESGKVTISGYVPDEATRSTLAAEISDLASDATDLADGAPPNFAISAGKGLEVLALLDSGSVKFDGANWAITGNVDTPQKGFAADAAYSIAALRTAGWSYEVHHPETETPAALPIIAPYVWQAQKAADGSVSFTGYVPGAGFKSDLKLRASNAADTTILGAGAPADFDASAKAGLDALLALDEGVLALAGEKWMLSGTTSSASSRDAVQSVLSAKTNAANWQVAIQARDAAPMVTPYLWAATKAADGSVDLTGYLPSESLKSFATVRAGTSGRDTTTIASGEPAGFSDDLLAGLDALSHLASGKASFDGSKWHLSGDAPDLATRDAALAALQKGTRGGALWDDSLSGYLPAPSSASAPDASAEATPDVTSLGSPQASSAEPMSSALSPSEPPPSESSAPSSSASIQSEASSSSIAPAQDGEITPTAPEVVPPMPDGMAFEATLKPGEAIVLQGEIPADSTATYFGAIAGNVKTDGLTPAPDLPHDFVPNAATGLTALGELSEGRLGFDGARWWLRGQAGQSVKEDVGARIAALPNGADWLVSIEVLQPIDICRARVDALAGRNAIVFNPGNVSMVPSSLPVLDELASDLEICPHSSVHVQGHTDADGDADGNLALSVARAEAVVAELVKRGVDESRLYAEGYGESDPIAPNETKAGKAKNRRIAFAISEE